MRNKQNLYVLMVFITMSCLLINEANAGDANGEIRGVFFENEKPCSLRINIHNATTGLYFGKTDSDSNGIFVVSNLPDGDYYLITHPADVGVRMPLQWRTENLKIDETNPQKILRQVDGFAVKTLYPQDGESVDLENVIEQNPLTFRWSPYSAIANYEIEIYSTDKTQYYKSGRFDTCSFSFNGIFQDGSRFRKRLYRWELRVFPAGTEWVGTSKPQDLPAGDLGKIQRYEGQYIQMDFPKWYEPTIDAMDLVNLLDTGYSIEKELSAGQVPSLGPLPGEKQGFLYDPTINFAYSGNPIHFGKNHLNENKFSLFITFHEMGHNFQFGGLPGFAYLLGEEYYDKTAIFNGLAEGLASLASLYVAETIDKNELTPLMKNLVDEENKSMREKFLAALESYETRKLGRDRMTPDILDGICIRLGDKFGWEMFPGFFRIFLKNDVNDQIYQLAGNDDTKRTTIFVTAFSVAADHDLRKQFQKWNYPIDNKFYKTILPLVKKSLTVN